jgi:sulfotransferase family protein
MRIAVDAPEDSGVEPRPRLPNFLIVGAAKSGTTTLASHLSKHPQVFVPPRKELYFFERDELWERGADWYANQFAGAGAATAVGEATPNYMFYPWAVQRIAEMLPGVRAIACLRDPVDRAYSHYLHWADRMWFEPRSFTQAVEDELAAGADQVSSHMHRRQQNPPYFGYLARGKYLPQLERLTATLGRESLHVVLLDDLQSDPAGTFAGVCAFLGVDPGVHVPDLSARENVYSPHTPRPVWRWLTRHRLLHHMPRRAAKIVARHIVKPRPRPVPPMDPDVRERLAEHFAPHTAALEAWLGRDLSAWTAPAKAPTGSPQAPD